VNRADTGSQGGGGECGLEKEPGITKDWPGGKSPSREVRYVSTGGELRGKENMLVRREEHKGGARLNSRVSYMGSHGKEGIRGLGQ